MAAKYNRVYKVNVGHLEQIRTLQGLGLSPDEATQFVPLGRSCIGRYMQVLDRVHAGQPITCNPQYYSADVVKTYCTAHGLPFSAQYTPAEPAAPAEPLPSAQECMDNMLRAFLDLTIAAEELANKMRGWQVDGVNHAG